MQPIVRRESWYIVKMNRNKLRKPEYYLQFLLLEFTYTKIDSRQNLIEYCTEKNFYSEYHEQYTADNLRANLLREELCSANIG